ncbi:hypothetical protein KZJ38_16465 [Paraburkholderia edwinii]|uniref:Uncharacterized protein n=1 Tax=Paraburkholderia edwinii TaxID=2861782 RepID=A0ABX8ULQ7_9BURK|nr:hypothetical protein [Paraburkholderia edwinii]QYD67898.1 hypothetical protein KZJ38_16465 [Paraburkholderia edwinii]
MVGMTRSIAVLTDIEPNPSKGKKSFPRLHLNDFTMRLVAPQSNQNQKKGPAERDAMHPYPQSQSRHAFRNNDITPEQFSNARPLAALRNVQSIDEFSSHAIALLQL